MSAALPPHSATLKLWTRAEARSHVLLLFADISLAALEELLRLHEVSATATEGKLSQTNIDHIIDQLLISGYDKEGVPAAEFEVREPGQDVPLRRAPLQRRWTKLEAHQFIKNLIPDIDQASVEEALNTHSDEYTANGDAFLLADLERVIDNLLESGYQKQREAVGKPDAEAEAALSALDKEATEAGVTVECSCCFGSSSPLTVAECSSGHVLCRECLRNYVGDRIGNRQHSLACIATSVGGEECDSDLVRADVVRFVDLRALEALDKIKQERGLAELDNWEVCPFCVEFGQRIADTKQPTFKCEKKECGKTSFRGCGKEAHGELSCDAAAAKEAKLPGLHKVEDAMSDALMRKCPNPKCKTPFIKDACLGGCNMMTCSTCRTSSCYLCKAIVTSHDHFNDPYYGGLKGQCALFDDTQARNTQEVEEARKMTASQFEPGAVDEAEVERLALGNAVASTSRTRY